MEQQQQIPLPRKKGNRNLLIGIAIIVVVAIIVFVSLSRISPPPNNIPPPTQPTILISAGTVYPISAGSYEYVQFSATQSATLTGTFNDTSSITMYLMTPSEFSSFSSTGTASSYQFTTGSVSQGTVNTNIASGTYYIVFVNTNSFTESSVTIISNYQITPLNV